MDLQKQLSKLEQDSFNGQISIYDFRKRVQTYAETYHALQLQQTDVVGRSEQLKCFFCKSDDVISVFEAACFCSKCIDKQEAL